MLDLTRKKPYNDIIMLVEVDRTGWENTFNLVNYLCLGKPARFSLLSEGERDVVAYSELFLGLEPYLQNLNPVLAVVLGKEKEVKLGYFLKDPSNIKIEQTSKQEIRRIVIDFEKEKTAVIDFFTVRSVFSRPKEVVYHHSLKRVKNRKPIVGRK